MVKRVKTVFLICLLIATFLFLTACSSSKITGKWNMSMGAYVDFTEEYLPDGLSGYLTLEFTKDGTYNVTSTCFMNGEEYNGKIKAGMYSYKDGALMLDGVQYECAVEGTTLQMKDQGSVATWQKSNN